MFDRHMASWAGLVGTRPYAKQWSVDMSSLKIVATAATLAVVTSTIATAAPRHDRLVHHKAFEYPYGEPFRGQIDPSERAQLGANTRAAERFQDSIQDY
jgi:hypothetical protein